MPFLTKDSGGKGFDPVPEDTHIARCITVVDIGIQDTFFGKKEQVYLGFEIPSIRVEWDDKEGVHHTGAALIGSTYTNSIHAKSILGQHLTSWRGKAFSDEEREGFEVFNVLGAPCLISVVHKMKGNNTYANINGIMRLPKGMVAPNPDGEQIAYSPQDATKIGNFVKLPEWLQKKCTEGHGNAAQSMGSVQGPLQDDFDDSIPF